MELRTHPCDVPMIAMILVLISVSTDWGEREMWTAATEVFEVDLLGQ